MLDLAIKAGVPIIKAHTSDFINLEEVLKVLANPKNVERYNKREHFKSSVVYYTTDPIEISTKIYETMVDAGTSLLLINQDDDLYLSFNVGDVPVPASMLRELLSGVAVKNQLEPLAQAFSGLTLKTASEVIRLVMAKEGSLTPKGVTQLRSLLAGKVQGLSQVDAGMTLYRPPLLLSEWVNRNKKFFPDSPDERLVPRGLLFHGQPGVGKSSAAKYIAQQFGVPLYRLDLSSALGKYVGESEGAFARLLSTLDQEGQAVLLVDEVEKLFGERDDSGVTSRLLSQMLWWLSEHQSRVLTVMTTNNIKILPEELYRAGRIDQRIELKPLGADEAYDLAVVVINQFAVRTNAINNALDRLCVKLTANTTHTVSHAAVVQGVYDLLKNNPKWIKS